MSKAIEPKKRNNVLIVAVTFVALVILLMLFWDRQQRRAIELRRIQSKMDFMQGLSDTIDWYRTNKAWWEPLK